MDGVTDTTGEERRLGGEDAALFEHRSHVLVDEGEEQAADVAAVHIRVAEDHDPPVPGGVDVELFTGARAHRTEQGLRFGVVEYLLEGGFSGVYHLAPQRQDGHVFGIAARLGRSGCRVALDDDQFRVEAVDPTVGQFFGHASGAHAGGPALGLQELP